MLEYVYGQNEIVAPAVAQLIPHCRRGFGPNVMTIGVVEGGLMIAGIVYHNWEPIEYVNGKEEGGIIEISGAALPGHYWLTRETIKRMFQYPFHYLGCQMVVQRTPADDEKLLYVLSRYGYSFVTVPRLFGRERDGVVCCLTREAWESNRLNQRLNHHIEQAPPMEAADAA